MQSFIKELEKQRQINLYGGRRGSTKTEYLKIPTYTCNRDDYTETYTGVQHIIVIGDIHGDFNILLKSLKKAKMIKNIDMNGRYMWIGKNTHVVQLGDILDKGGRGIDSSADTLEEFHIYDYLNRLHQKAKEKGGAVHYLIGNHEIMNMVGDFRYVHHSHVEDTGSILRQQLFQPGGHMANMLACHAYAILKINDWYFCHAGILPENITNRSIRDINKLVRTILRGTKTVDDLDDKERELVFGSTGFLWNRDYALNDDRCSILSNTLSILNKQSGRSTNDGGMVVGHTPHRNIKSYCNEKLWFADVGLSSGFGDKFSSIEILSIKKGEKPIVIRN